MSCVLSGGLVGVVRVSLVVVGVVREGGEYVRVGRGGGRVRMVVGVAAGPRLVEVVWVGVVVMWEGGGGVVVEGWGCGGGLVGMVVGGAALPVVKGRGLVGMVVGVVAPCLVGVPLVGVGVGRGEGDGAVAVGGSGVSRHTRQRRRRPPPTGRSPTPSLPPHRLQGSSGRRGMRGKRGRLAGARSWSPGTSMGEGGGDGGRGVPVAEVGVGPALLVEGVEGLWGGEGQVSSIQAFSPAKNAAPRSRGGVSGDWGLRRSWEVVVSGVSESGSA